MSITGITPITISNSVKASKISTYGEIRLHQRNIIPSYSSIRKYYRNDQLIDFSKCSLEELDIENILNRYYSRNYTLSYDQFQYIWKPTISSSTLDINATFYIPLQPIIYEPNLSQILLFGWIQYLSVLIIVLVLIYWLGHCLYTNQYLTTETKSKYKID